MVTSHSVPDKQFGGFKTKEEQKKALEKAISESKKKNPYYFTTKFQGVQKAQLNKSKSNVDVYNRFKEESLKNPNWNLGTYMKESYGIEDPSSFKFTTTKQAQEILMKPIKYEDERSAIQLRESMLKHEQFLKSKGIDTPELNLLNKEQVAKWNEIANINTGMNRIEREEAIQDFASSVDSFVSSGISPESQTPKTEGDSKVFTSGSQDTTLTSLGNQSNDVKGKIQTNNEKVSQEDKSFFDQNKSNLMILGGIGLLGLFLLSRRK